MSFAGFSVSNRNRRHFLAAICERVRNECGGRSIVVVESLEPDARTDREGTRQELHHTERPAAAQRRAAVSAHQGTAGSDTGGGMGGGQRRSQRKRRLSVRQTAATPDRWADSLSHETD